MICRILGFAGFDFRDFKDCTFPDISASKSDDHNSSYVYGAEN
jgi:hypothetical protein